ncbi:MFS transporter [Chitinophaga sp. GCM10012297]|uniref:MFS transporter n=1 Tax=Chitinophaga chungangae TaxID=2821488 RepID=A0ABS3YGW2_9BACT|nr:MFS transporter [Chitinophaga chungangae]MBO9153339.1 MFS transporter [Chitinophaga chungangae]
MKNFYLILVNSILAGFTNTCVWFAVTFWVYLETKSVLVTSYMAGIYIGTVSVSGFFLGSIVDRYRKKTAMLFSSAVTLVLFTLAAIVYLVTPPEAFKDPYSFRLWVFIVLCLFGVLAGNIRNIALPTMVTFMVEENSRDKANGLLGSAAGTAFMLASIPSGFVIGFMGVFWMMMFGIGLTVVAIVHLLTIRVEETRIVHAEGEKPKVDIPGTIAVIRKIPGLFGLIFFNTLNNFLGGVFMALMDAYGLSLVSVQAWGTIWAVLSTGFIIGGLVVARTGLGKSPIRLLFLSNIVMWTICIFFTVQASIILLSAGMFIFLCLIPVVEAAEQTVIQKVIPPDRQGRVFGFAQSIEQAASPLTAFMIGPIAQYVFIPFMTTGKGVDLLGWWFGTGMDRGIALLFTVTGILGLIITMVAMRTRAYAKLVRI